MVDAVLESRLLGACVAAVLRHPASSLLQLHAARALRRVAEGGKACMMTVVDAEGCALLATMLQHPSPTREVACDALDVLARAGARAEQAVVHQGAADALIGIVASPAAG